MSITVLVAKGWEDHARAPAEVAGRCEQAIPQIANESDIAQLARLGAHVYGEHLGRWNDGVAYLEKLRGSSHFVANGPSDEAIGIWQRVLRFAAGDASVLDGLERSGRIRVLAQAGAALVGQHELGRAEKFLREALALAGGLAKEDPANRALVVVGNNLACTLEEKKPRSAAENELMVLAAQTGRKYWEIAGGPAEIAMAEYRLSFTYREAGDAEESFNHAKLCVATAMAGGLGPLDAFFAYEALALAARGVGESQAHVHAVQMAEAAFAQLDEGMRAAFASNLEKIR